MNKINNKVVWVFLCHVSIVLIFLFSLKNIYADTDMSICTRILKFGNACKITCYWCRYTFEGGLPGDGQRSPRSSDSCCFAFMKSLYPMLPDESRTTRISRNWPYPSLS